ncbi:hypothetical protein CYMTET_36258 [Cymbomonas tetramitiformis]|uniref:Uncharacterized protein n=1 Tax=Cymbomonas tetramitiformis TaxID=36881 RepID=A0AAE0F7D6_9CHLO|nr:hypothetical protein CYMTET_36258 [Cymbomonas tetramitiformis]
MLVTEIGGCAPPGSTLAGMALAGLGLHQSRTLACLGLLWFMVGMVVFVPLFTHRLQDDGHYYLDSKEHGQIVACVRGLNPSRQTLAHDWGFYCHHTYELGLLGFAYFLGSAVGGAIGVWCNDFLGRRRCVLLAGCALTAAQGSAALAPGPEAYAAARFLLGAASTCMLMGSFKLGLEWCPPTWHVCVGVGYFPMMFAYGQLFLVPLAYAFRGWRSLNGTISLGLAVATALSWEYLPESLEELRKSGHLLEEEELLTHAAAFNAQYFRRRVVQLDLLGAVAQQAAMAALGCPVGLALACTSTDATWRIKEPGLRPEAVMQGTRITMDNALALGACWMGQWSAALKAMLEAAQEEICLRLGGICPALQAHPPNPIPNPPALL